MDKKKCGNIFWASNAIALGVWEATAVTTKRVPTISRTVARSRRRWPYGTVALLVLWKLGLFLHLWKNTDIPDIPLV